VPYTYRDLIRKYSADVAGGSADVDLDPRERRLCAVMLNLASNAGWAAVAYPPTDGTRDAVVAHLAEIVWDARPLVDAVSPASADAFTVALDRALTILRGM
jgi:hypothetical protein